MPAIYSVIGLLIGIPLVMFLEVQTTEGAALLIFICILMTMLIGSIVSAIFRRRVRQ